MSEIEGSVSLLGHSEQSTPRWKRDTALLRYKKNAWIYVRASVVTLLLLFLSMFSVFYLQWRPSFETSKAQVEVWPILASPERDLKILLHPEEHVSRDPGTRQYSWNITRGTIAADGVQKVVFLINDQFPGPTIEVRTGDTLDIEVFNFAEEGISLHWHGLHMRGSNHMDGPVGVTQCAIKQGERFQYRVPIDDQVGTFWYHAHSEVQRADGLYGGLIVHSPIVPYENISNNYDIELLFLVGDWYHRPATEVLAIFEDRTSMGLEPAPDSLLLNGLGYFECSMATHAYPVDCSEIKSLWILLDKKKRYRFRVVNVGSLAGFSFSIPDSEMKVFQVDGGLPVIENADPVNSVGVLYPAERVDFVVAWPASMLNTDAEIIISLDKEYFLKPNFALTPTQSFLLRPESKTPQPKANNTDLHTFDLRDAKGPALLHPLSEVGQTFMIYTAVQILNHLNGIPKGFINYTFWEPQNLPLLALNRQVWDEHQLVPWTGAEPVWVELTINNIDTSGHPFHLHGFDFYVIASYEGRGGWDYYNPFTPSTPPRGGPFNLVNPPLKDTVYVPPWGYVVIRFLADNPGIWTLHCHILWHQASGMSMAFQVQGDEGTGFSGDTIGLQAEQSCKLS